MAVKRHKFRGDEWILNSSQKMDAMSADGSHIYACALLSRTMRRWRMCFRGVVFTIGLDWCGVQILVHFWCGLATCDVICVDVLQSYGHPLPMPLQQKKKKKILLSRFTFEDIKNSVSDVSQR